MRSADAIKSILEGQGRPQRSLAIDLGLTPQALDQRLKSKTMKVETLCQTAAQFNYSVKLVPNDGGESIEIEVYRWTRSLTCCFLIPKTTWARPRAPREPLSARREILSERLAWRSMLGC